jgi:hypothetical protein
LGRVTEESIINQMRNLDPGHSFSRSKRIVLEECDREPVSNTLQKLRNLVNQSVGRLRNECPDRIYRVESVTGLTADNQAIIATVAVTRMDDDDGDTDI